MRKLYSYIALIIAISPASISYAQQQATIRDVVEADAQEAALVETATEIQLDSMDMATPLRSIVNLGRAIDQNELDRTAEFLDLRYLPDEMKETPATELVRRLRFVWNRTNILDLGKLSDEPEGHRDDGLPSYRDLLGTIHTPDGPVPIYMQRIPGEGGTQVWKISNASVAEIPDLWEEYGYGAFTRRLVEILPDLPPVLDLENWQIVYILLIIILSWPMSVLIASVSCRVITRLSDSFPEAWPKFFGWPIKVFIYIYLIRALFDEISLPLRARVVFDHGIGPYIAFGCLLIGGIEFFITYQARKLRMADRGHAIPLIRPFGLMAKCLVIIVMFLIWAENAGYDMTTLIAGLGVGSVAVALAAKNTVENLIGAITIYIARPISPGDFCRFGTVLGTIEEVGLRATVIRTRDQSLVYIPNAIFAADEVENYSARERFRYFRDFRIRLDTSADQVRYVLVELRRLFQSHPRVYEDTVSIRFDEVSDDAINLRVDAQIKTADFQDYLAIAEDLNLQILDTLGSSGTWFAMPTRTVKTESAEDQDHVRAEEIRKLVSEWKQEDRLMFTDYGQERQD